jgi:hypothetical protein
MLSITFKTHKQCDPIGFNNQSMVVQSKFGETLQSLMWRVNECRNGHGSDHITDLYNIFGKHIPFKLWSIKLKEHITLYIDHNDKMTIIN